MREFPTLKFIDKFKWLFIKIGVDYTTMRLILQAKLLMDRRRVPTVFSNNAANKKQTDSNQFIKSLWIYALLGLILIPFILMDESYIFSMSIVFAILMFFLMTSMISDFSQVLLDLRDKSIISTKPVDKRTINAVKIVHISIYMFFLCGTITGIPLLVSIFAQGFGFFFVFITSIILINLLIVVVTALLYILILKMFDGEKLKDIINYVQIILSATIIIGYQLVIRSFELIHLDLSFDPQLWHVLLPPVWYGAVFEIIFMSNQHIYFIIFSLIAILMPFISIFIYIKSIPSFERNLEKLMSAGSERKQRLPYIVHTIGSLICRNKEEKTFYDFTRIMLKNERQFKLKIYPLIGFSFLFPFIMIFSQMRMTSLEEIANSQQYFSIYFSGLMIPTVVLMLRYSEHYKGAWIFRALPIKSIASLNKGALKAFLVHLYLPVFLLLSAAFLYVFSTRILLDLLIFFLSVLIYIVICFKALNTNRLLFSETFEVSQQQGTGMVLLLFVLAFFFFIVHFIVSFIPFGIYVYGGILLILNIIFWKKLL
ncbi:hypothetical protein [Evansella cellulosilytica]|uniref:Uncharacterized protein n=1 Tax=Evansella cellulosilytica (strain ATCC 21833 / DSM 2522 / FERM P-1141 / JCM 9156 / N-4) TaxID=649639 RepID=E6TQJ7_EVAC2|nr:hypothetical protein [Evansella cellulosilytica]ADU30508.1 hypothetical protein Bcell_2248 [Evansella cellulosilytica DSM 2522]